APPPASAHLLHHQLPPLISQKKKHHRLLRRRLPSPGRRSGYAHGRVLLRQPPTTTKADYHRWITAPKGPMDGGRSMCGGPLWNIHGRRPYGGRSMGGGTKHAAGGGSHTRLPESCQTKLPLDYLTTWSESPPLGWDASVLLPVHEIIMPCSPWAAGQKGTQQLMHTWAKKKRGILRSFCTIHDCTTRESNFYASAPQGSQFQL
ncbi:unnamed protein product, partial [Urochloa humidicola]